MKNKHQKCVFRPPNYKYEGGCRGHFRLFHLNLLVSNVYFWSTQLPQLNHIINMFSGTFRVTVNILKNDGHIVFRGQIKVIYVFPSH